MERGDADISFDLPAKDFSEMKKEGKLKLISNPITNGMYSVEMNVAHPPFNNEKVRQAVAYAIPYQKIVDGGDVRRRQSAVRRQVERRVHDKVATTYRLRGRHGQAKALMTESGAGAINTTISFDLGDAVNCEPIAELIQESLAHIGITTTINKMPGSNWRSEMAKKSMPMMVNFFSGWLDYPEYFFFWCYSGQNAIFNTPSYVNKDMDTLIDGARAAAAVGDWPKYDTDVKGFISKAYHDVPRVPLFQPYLNVAMQKNISGYSYWFHRQVDYRSLVKA